MEAAKYAHSVRADAVCGKRSQPEESIRNETVISQCSQLD